MLTKNIAVLGVGTAGLMSLSHCLAHLSKNSKIISIHDPTIPMLGIGESTTVALPEILFAGADFTMLNDYQELDATIKQGVKYVDWRENDFFSNIIPPSHAIHFNNFKLKDFCFARFRSIWRDKFVEHRGKVLEIIENTNNVIIKTQTENIVCDYVIDCRGWPEGYTDFEILDSIPVNHCLVNMVSTPGDWNYTYHVAHRNGWMFGIPLKTRQGWGYLYNDQITDRQDALEDISERFKTPISELNLREFTFKNFRAKKFLQGRILKNGNRALFYEPLEALSGHFYHQVLRYFFDFLWERNTSEEINKFLYDLAVDTELFMCYVYHGGSNYDSNFWNTVKSKTTLKLQNSERFKFYVDRMKNFTVEDRNKHISIGPLAFRNWYDFDQYLGYKYFSN